MELLTTEEVFNRIRGMINSATKRVVILTDKLNETLVEDLERKAASGVDVRVVTPDLNWARWLKNRPLSYRREEEERLNKEIERLSSWVEIYNRLPWIVLTIVGASWIVLLLRGVKGALILPFLVVGLLAIYMTMFISYRRKRSCKEEMAVKSEDKKRIEEELLNIRENLSKHIEVDEIDYELSFSIIVADADGLFTSTPLQTAKERGYHMSMRFDVDEATRLIEEILRSKKSVAP
ncbi:MAG: hypothetical protein RXS23_02115 [Metallosphaera yellowstonensis]|jgi:hypothetical protein|uniref:Uncharacterized protein n=1 Tax=Metallosphaera yellowstonensis MK1 TaxID=671065 RepID=H2C3M2_9CREN|nr:hypothetical protein [Metallosphaera yellowstonensis]EHP70843.1 hypothetical protein MetMK1DRAFT_00013470 [Metallosphaera yellowstonensis MK1]